MKAAVVEAVGAGFVIEDISIDEPRAHEVLVDIQAVGLCHTDLTLATTDLGFAMPAVFGHEISGVVQAVGAEVTGLTIGDHVVGSLLRFCGKCARCRRGQSYICRYFATAERSNIDQPRLQRSTEPLAQAFGLGGFAEAALVHEHQLVRIDPKLPFDQAAILGCGVITGAGAVLNTAKVERGETVVVIGAGGVGLNTVSGAVIAGASEIVVIDVAQQKLERALEFGATHTINAVVDDPIAALFEHLPEGADYVFDLVGSAETIRQGLQMLTYGGGMYLVGISGSIAPVPIDVGNLMRNKNRLETVYMGSSNISVDIPYFVNLALRGLLPLEELIAERIALEEINEGYQRLREGVDGRVVITKNR